MAHAALGNAYYSYIYNLQVDGQQEYEKALSLASRTTDRERMLIQAEYAANRNHTGDADRYFRSYLRLYPDDATVHFDYANLLRKNGRDADAIDQYNEAIRIMPDFAHAYVGIATVEKKRGDYPQALQAYSKAFEIEPSRLTSGNINREYGFALVANGEGDKAQQLFSALLDRPETGLRENGLRSLAFLDLYYGRYASAEDRLNQSLLDLQKRNIPLGVARVHLLLAIVAEGTGDSKAQLQNLDAALNLLNVIQAKVAFGSMLGDAYARAGRVDQADKIAGMIAPLADANNADQMGDIHLLQGDIALSRGRTDDAIALLTQSEKDKSNGLSIEALAHAYQQSGDIDRAVASYEKMLSLPEPSLGWEPQQRWLVARYTLASDYETRGDKQKARDTLATFLNLWKDADPDLVTFHDAKSLYARVQ